MTPNAAEIQPALVKQTPARNAQALAEKLLGSTSPNRTRQEE